MILVPISSKEMSRDQIPWVTLAIIVVNLVVFLTVGLSAHRASQTAYEKLEEAFEYWLEHPYLDIPPEFMDQAIGDQDPEQVAEVIKAVNDLAGTGSPGARFRQQRELNILVEDYLATRLTDPYRTWGLIPNDPRPVAFVTSMFLHAGWLHLLGNMLWLWVTAPFLELAYGRVVFPAFYLLAGVIAALVHIGAQPGADVPLIGASGAIAGLMGAFVVRFSHIKIRFFYWVFVVVGTFRAPSWIMLVIWFGIQLVMVGLLGAESHVAYWAHIGGFGFGAAVAYGLRFVDFEERFRRGIVVEPERQPEIPEIESGMQAITAGNGPAAREIFERVLEDTPDQRAALLGLWKANLMIGRPDDAVPCMSRLITDELRTGEREFALDHWHELVNSAHVGGPAAMRWKLACSLQPFLPAGALDVFAHLANDASGGMLSAKAMDRLTQLVTSDEERDHWRRRAAEARRAVEAASEDSPPTSSGPSSSPGAPSSPRPEIDPLASPLAVADAAPTSEATTGVGAGDDPPLTVLTRRLVGLVDDHLVLYGSRQETLATSSISRVIVAAIVAQPKPYLLIDLVLGVGGKAGRSVVRIESRSLDPASLLARSDLAPMDAFRELVIRIARDADAPLVPNSVTAGQYPRFENLSTYEETFLG